MVYATHTFTRLKKKHRAKTLMDKKYVPLYNPCPSPPPCPKFKGRVESVRASQSSECQTQRQICVVFRSSAGGRDDHSRRVWCLHISRGAVNW